MLKVQNWYILGRAQKEGAGVPRAAGTKGKGQPLRVVERDVADAGSRQRRVSSTDVKHVRCRPGPT